MPRIKAIRIQKKIVKLAPLLVRKSLSKIFFVIIIKNNLADCFVQILLSRNFSVCITNKTAISNFQLLNF